MSVASRGFLLSITFALLAVAQLARAQGTRTWTGVTNSNWGVSGNWNAALVPGSGDTALFNSAGNGNTTISLGGATQPIRNINFDNAAAAAYTLGIIPSSDKFNFDANGMITVSGTVTKNQKVNAAIQTNGSLTISNSAPLPIGLTLNGDLTLGNSGTLTVNLPNTQGSVTLNGIIAEVPGQPGSMSLSATSLGAVGNVFIINGANTFTGPATINVNTGSNGRVELGSNTPFGTGRVTINLVSGAPPLQINGENGTRTLTNPIDFNSGMTLVGNNSLNFNGPLTIINSAVGGSRTFNNSITSIAAGGGVSFGASPGSSTITLGNPVSNGGDGVGKTLIFTPAAGAMTFINSVMQDPAPGGGAASGSVQYAGSIGGLTQINSFNTYSGPTMLNGSSTIQFSRDHNIGTTSGPFGIGTLTPNASPNNILQPIGGNRTIANPIAMNFGFTVANATGDSSSLTLAGPITMSTPSGTFITNNFGPGGGTLTLGSAASPSTLSIGSTLTFQTQVPGGGLTVINDAISGTGAITVQNSAIVHMNGTSSYSGATSITGSGSPKLFVNGIKSGTGSVSIGAVGTLGGTGVVAGTITNNGTIAPGTSVGTLTAAGNVIMGANSHLAIELNGAAADKLVVAGNLNLSNVEFLDVTGSGSGSSWVIATYGSLTGTFNNVTPGYSVNYGSGTNSQITLNLSLSGINGDFDNNGKVETGDYVTWRRNNGTSNALPNDNGLGTPVGPSHYTLWRSNFGKPPGSSAVGETVSIPEPAGLVLVAMMLVCIKRLRVCGS